MKSFFAKHSVEKNGSRPWPHNSEMRGIRPTRRLHDPAVTGSRARRKRRPYATHTHTHTGGRVLRAVLLCLRGHTHTCFFFTRIVVLSLDIIKRAVCLNYPLPSSTLLSTPHPLHAGRRQLPTLSPLLGRRTPAGEEKER